MYTTLFGTTWSVHDTFWHRFKLPTAPAGTRTQRYSELLRIQHVMYDWFKVLTHVAGRGVFYVYLGSVDVVSSYEVRTVCGKLLFRICSCFCL